MEARKLGRLGLREGGLFLHDRSDLADYDAFFEFVIANGEMMGRVDALHSQHLRNGAKKDVLCVRPVDLWGERTYPVHRGRPGGRFISKITDGGGAEVGIEDLADYRQALDPRTGVLQTSYSWRRNGSAGANTSLGFMSKPRKHLMAHRYRDEVGKAGWKRSFRVETVFPYHSRASVFYFKKPYNPKSWAWGEVEHENEIEPVNNATVEYEPAAAIATLTFATEFSALRTEVVWALAPSPSPDAWEIDRQTGAITFTWDLPADQARETTIVAVLMTDRDAPDSRHRARDEAMAARGIGWEGLAREQMDWWRRELGKSRVDLPDESLQKLYEASMYYMLGSVGGSYWGFIGVDNVIYETCMCDNPIMVHSLVETNHLELAGAELALLDRYLPAARRNATERMKAVLGIENTEAAILPFYMTEDGVELWQDNVMGMYTVMSAYHVLSLLKTSRYTGDRQSLRAAYPWLKAYAEYGRLHAELDPASGSFTFPIVSMGGGGEGYWWRQTMSQKLYYRIFSRPDPLFRFADFPPIEFFPKEEIAKLESNWIDTVLNYRWILAEAASCAEELDLDPDLRGEWRRVAANLRVPQNDCYFLSHGGRDSRPSIGGAAVGGLFWPAEGTFEEFDPEKVARTVQEIVHARNTAGLKSGGRAWDGVFAFFLAFMGKGEEAYQVLRAFDHAADHRGIEMREAVEGQNYYYLLNHGSFILLTRFMMLLTYRGKIRVFPAVPMRWRERGVAFAGMPAEGGYLVSGRTGPAGTEVTVHDRTRAVLLKLSGAFPSLELVPSRISVADPEKLFEVASAEGPIEVEVPTVREGAEYLVETSSGKQVLTAGTALRFVVRAPTGVRIALRKQDA